ncbi:MAG: hypothetical protein R3C11_23495 [Planctomycetaceae bacterium]
MRAAVRKQIVASLFGIPSLTSEPATYAEKKAQSSELMYELLTTGKINGDFPLVELGGVSDTVDFSSSEVGDTDGDGNLEFVDGWGEPLRFFAFATRIVKSEDNDIATDNSDVYTEKFCIRLLMPSLSDMPLTSLDRDQDDPTGQLDSWSDFISTPELNYHTPHTYHQFLIVSAGNDKTLGLFEPTHKDVSTHTTRTLPNLWACPLDETEWSGGDDYNENGIPNEVVDPAETDSSVGTHAYNSPMNDDITNYQEVGGS